MAAVDSVTQHRFFTNALLGLSPVPILGGQPRPLMAPDTHGRTVRRHLQQHTETIRSIVQHLLPRNLCAASFGWPLMTIGRLRFNEVLAVNNQ